MEATISANYQKYCIVCRGITDFKFLFKTKDNISLKTFDIIQCKKCNLVITDFSAEDDISTFYPSTYRNYEGFREHIKNSIYNSLTSLWYSKYRPKIVLEVGCGDGYMLNRLKRLGVDKAIGVELEKFTPTETDKESIDIYSSISEVKEDAFEFIILYNSLEHLHNLEETLLFIKKRIDSNGSLNVTVPNFNSCQSKILKNRWVHLDAPRHLYHFTSESLNNLLNNFGFKPISYGKTSRFYDFFGWIMATQNLFLLNNSKFKTLLSALVFMSTVPFTMLVGILMNIFGDRALLNVTYQLQEKV